MCAVGGGTLLNGAIRLARFVVSRKARRKLHRCADDVALREAHGVLLVPRRAWLAPALGLDILRTLRADASAADDAAHAVALTLPDAGEFSAAASLRSPVYEIETPEREKADATLAPHAAALTVSTYPLNERNVTADGRPLRLGSPIADHYRVDMLREGGGAIVCVADGW